MREKERKMKKLFLLLFSISFVLFTGIFCRGGAESDMEGAARGVYDVFHQAYGTSESLNERAIMPLTGQGKFYTIDRGSSFTAGLMCPASFSFLQISVSPTETGDFNFSVLYDTDFDGNMDKNFSTSGISGVCSNGIIKCSPGTWTGCHYYKFDMDDAMNLLLKEVSRDDVYGCFCINNDCGSDLLIKNMDYVLKTLGGQIAGLFQRVNPHYLVSKREINGNTIYYFGQSEGSCSLASGEGEVGERNPEYYFSHPDELSEAGKTFMGSGEGEVYTEWFQSLTENYQERTCYIRKRAVTRPTYYVRVTLGKIGDNYWCDSCGTHTLTGSFYLERVDMVKSFKLVRAKFDDWIKVWLNGHLIYAGPWANNFGNPCELGTSWDKKLDIDAKDYLVEGKNTFKIQVIVAGCGEGYVDFRGEFPTEIFNCEGEYCHATTLGGAGCAFDHLETDDECEDIDTSVCSLKDEIRDGVYVIQNGEKIGLYPVYSCRDICDKSVCTDWWTIERHYLCKTSTTTFDPSKRMETIAGSIAYDGSTLTYNDVRYENGTWVNVNYSNQKVDVSLSQGESCVQICKVKIPLSKVPVQSDNYDTHPRTDITSSTLYREEYRECENGICPINTDAGEEMITSCGCLSAFNDAAAMLQAIRLASQDMICSSGTTGTLAGY